MIPAGPVFGSSLGVSGVVGGVGVAGIQSSEFVECFELSYSFLVISTMSPVPSSMIQTLIVLHLSLSFGSYLSASSSGTVLIVLSDGSQTSTSPGFGTVTFASSQSSGPPGTVGVSTQAVFLIDWLEYCVALALMLIVSLWPTASDGMV